MNQNQPAVSFYWPFHRLILFSLLVTTLPQVGSAQAPLAKPVNLKCDSLVNPLGLDSKAPMLSWQLRDERYGARQTAYEIQVSSGSALLATGQADVWDSGRVESEQSAGVTYAGPVLLPERRYFWRVKVWDKDGKPYPASDTTRVTRVGGRRGCWIPKNGAANGLEEKSMSTSAYARPMRPGSAIPR